MFRSILEFLALLLFFAVARAVIGAVSRMFRSAMEEQPRREQSETFRRAAPAQDLQSAGELRKDPVCGTFVPVASSVSRVVNGEKVYFCSVDCRDSYLASSK